MWINTQDRKSLINTYRIASIEIVKEREEYVLRAFTSAKDWCDLGAYSDEDKAALGLSAIANAIERQNFIYTMPWDESNSEEV